MKAMEGNHETDLPMRELWRGGPESVVGGDEAPPGGRQVPGLPAICALRTGEAAGEEESGLRARLAVWKAYVEERIAYWRFAGETAIAAGLEDNSAAYCAWKVLQFEELRRSLRRMEELLPEGAK